MWSGELTSGRSGQSVGQ